MKFYEIEWVSKDIQCNIEYIYEYSNKYHKFFDEYDSSISGIAWNNKNEYKSILFILLLFMILS